MDLLAAFKNIKFTNSIVAGGAASVLVYAIGALLVASGVVIPAITIPLIGLHLFGAALTTGQVATAAILIGHLISAVVPDSVNQAIEQLAAKLPQYQAMVPGVYASPQDYPNPPPTKGAPSNINLAKADAAVTVIQAHVDAVLTSGKTGA